MKNLNTNAQVITATTATEVTKATEVILNNIENLNIINIDFHTENSIVTAVVSGYHNKIIYPVGDNRWIEILEKIINWRTIGEQLKEIKISSSLIQNTKTKRRLKYTAFFLFYINLKSCIYYTTPKNKSQILS